MKFVILDEVDYMTKNAQQALRYLLQNYSNTVRFCLICNYISKIDEGLQNEFMRLRFNQLPKKDINVFLKNISISEKLFMSDKSIDCIQKLYKSDIRSMINFMQSNQDMLKVNNNSNNSNDNKFNDNFQFNIIDNDVWEFLSKKIHEKENIQLIVDYIHNISIKYNIDKKNIVKDYLNYIIRNKIHIISNKFLNFVENVMHSQECNNNIYIHYFISNASFYI
jgi:DNA polymerase III delta prime subunit